MTTAAGAKQKGHLWIFSQFNRGL